MSLVIENLVKNYELPKGKTFTALKGVSLGIAEGEFCTLLGPSGCGKTTLLRTIAGFEEFSSGTMTYKGKSLKEVPVNERAFPMVFQSYALFPHMKVWDNIAYGLKLQKVSKAEIERRVQKVVDLVGLGPNQNKFPTQMSGGQQQRVALARALVMEPEVILFDEPLSNLDAKLRVFMRDEIRKIQRELGVTAVYVTHDQEEAMAISDRIVVMNQGVIEQVGTPQEVYRRPRTQFVADFVGSANIVPVDVHGESASILNIDYALSDFDFEAPKSLVLRPEDIHLSAEATNCAATVTKMTFLGSKWSGEVEVQGQRLSVDIPPTEVEMTWKPGDTVYLKFSPTHFLS